MGINRFDNYQCLPDQEMSDLDKLRTNSKFWNKGKWDNFVLPLLPKDCSEMTFTDVGCGAGLFLNYAEDLGFSKVVGVEYNEKEVNRGIEWRDKCGKKYQLFRDNMATCINNLPVSDYIVLANVHYWFEIYDWLRFMEQLINKTRYCIVVTNNEPNFMNRYPSNKVSDLRKFFENWKEIDYIKQIPYEDDPSPRKLCSLLFESPNIKRVNIDDLLDNRTTRLQENFYKELDSGIEPIETTYFKKLVDMRAKKLLMRKWSDRRMVQHIISKVNLYNDIRENGIKVPVLINKDRFVVEGAHRREILKHLGYKTMLVREL